jgi:glucosamine--fructose-6-phosphate aminotransferase (isomerizing)
MCGIAGFVSNELWRKKPDLAWLDALVNEFEDLLASGAWEAFTGPLGKMADRFDDLMSFGLHMEIVENSAARAKVERIAALLDMAHERLVQHMADEGRTDALELIGEDMRDGLWQIREEVLGNVSRVNRLLPDKSFPDGNVRARRFVAWAIEEVMENLDRLEVRGRDSAGIAIQCCVPAVPAQQPTVAPEALDGKFRETIVNGVKSSRRGAKLNDGRLVFTFVYKVANLVGSLGENTGALRRSIHEDEALWSVGGFAEQVSVLAHTRWASNGIISLSNCHPCDGRLLDREHEATLRDRDALFVLNGDVDNYHALVNIAVLGQGYAIDPVITTDAKILPVFFRLGTDPASSLESRFAAVMNGCEGSLAIVMQHPTEPRTLYLGQKGSGQSLFVGKIRDGAILASEVYGLASRTRRSYALSGTERGGTQFTLTMSADGDCALGGAYLEDGGPFELKPEAIYIHSRDIYRGAYNYYFEKEIHEAPSSVRKTFKGKYRKVNGVIEFSVGERGTFASLVSRLRETSLPPVRRIMCIGQGTAAVAAMGVAYLVERALANARVAVSWSKASEMSGFLPDESLSDVLVIAISQSGTTTDTNRTVDVAGAHGAWVHAIVNRRNSPLVAKSNSHFYTSDGRDVEMAVASTKAFYSQIAAGKLTALLLAQEFGTMTPSQIYEEIHELERLPADIEWVLGQARLIDEIASKYGPSSRNWAVVGNGPNKIAADEIRIKLSELCYKSIPVDFTEDKKHIDLSTEPLTLVVANDLPDAIVQDTAKEVSIFKAHSGKPLVLCARGEKRFNGPAERLIEIPVIGGGLGFVLATVAGHLWGFSAAKAIDAGAEELRKVRGLLTNMLEQCTEEDGKIAKAALDDVMEMIARGDMNASLPSSTVAVLAAYGARLGDGSGTGELSVEDLQEGITILSKAAEEMTRPIDTIRHQAKTVTVGISRPQETVPPLFLSALEELFVFPARIKEPDKRMLRAVAPIISEVAGGILYKMVPRTGVSRPSLANETPWIQTAARGGFCVGKPSRYDQPRIAGGSKRTVLRLERALWTSGASGEENLVLIPLLDDEEGEWSGIALLHIKFADEAPIHLKMAALRGLGNRYHDIIERLEEVSPGESLEELLNDISPRDLVLTPVDRLVFPERPSHS